jgi:uncharacterized tellurite resistance protein B-like protein
MSMQFADLAQRASQDGVIDAEELLSLRQMGWGDGQIHRGEAEAIFAINNALEKRDDAWVDFFVEAISEFVLNGTQPRGMCDEAEARWLIDQIDHDGKLESMAELECLVRIVERAQNVPCSLKHYVLRQIEAAVLTGEGPTRYDNHAENGGLAACHISTVECALLRRVIFASGGHGPAAVSRFDAELLFGLKDASLGKDNALDWQHLFVDGVANYLQGFALKNAQVSHERMKELESFIADNDTNVGRFFGRMAREVPQTANHLGKVFGKKEVRKSFAEWEADGAEVTSDEQKWLDAMIDADGTVDPLEQALLKRIAEED